MIRLHFSKLLSWSSSWSSWGFKWLWRFIWRCWTSRPMWWCHHRFIRTRCPGSFMCLLLTTGSWGWCPFRTWCSLSARMGVWGLMGT